MALRIGIGKVRLKGDEPRTKGKGCPIIGAGHGESLRAIMGIDRSTGHLMRQGLSRQCGLCREAAPDRQQVIGDARFVIARQLGLECRLIGPDAQEMKESETDEQESHGAPGNGVEAFDH